MKKFLAMVSIFCATALLAAATGVFADDSTVASSTTPRTSSSKSTKSHKKKAQPTPTPQVTAQPTMQATVPATPSPTAVTKAAVTTAAPAPSLFSGNERIYDRVGAPGDLQKAISAAARATGSSLKHDRSVFLWLGRVTNGSDDQRNNSYIRFNLDGVAFDGPKKPSLVLTGNVYDQSGSDCKAGDPIEVAVDFREIKVDYEGTKLGEVNKGNDIADQVFDILNSHSNYQWVLIAQDQLRDPQDSMGMPSFVVKAQEGYAFLQSAAGH